MSEHLQPSIDFFPTQQPVAKIGGNAFHVPPVEGSMHDTATGTDVEIRGALNCSEEAMASHNGGAQECTADCEAEVEPTSFLLALLGDQKGTACSFGSPHALPEGIAMRVGHVQEGALARGEVSRWVLGLLQRDLVGLIARRLSFDIVVAAVASPQALADRVTLYASAVASQRPLQNSGPSGSLFLSRKALASSTPYRFIPASYRGPEAQAEYRLMSGCKLLKAFFKCSAREVQSRQ